jgi:GR25 family glycosyltransferase involved in LPS biosynthesis|uniref:Glycosyltransferase n=1 Tax=viral metagenome TaxID=1070528 RepID=A0A6C0DY47_9ZZZZ
MYKYNNNYCIIKYDYSNLKSFTINLDDYKENYNKQAHFLLKIGLVSERFSGVNALKDEHFKSIYKKYVSNFALNYTPKSVIGCALSHIMCCKHIYKNYIKKHKTHDYARNYFLIMEDDAFPLYEKDEFYEKLNKTLQDIEILDSNWEIIQLHSDGIMPTIDTYSTHIGSISAAAYIISKKAIIKTLKSKIYSHIDLIHHNFMNYNKYRAKENLFYTDEKNSLNRIVAYKLSSYSLHFKSKIFEFLNYYTNIIQLRGEKKFLHYFEYKIFKDPFFNKEFNANDIIDYFIGLKILSKLYYYKN